jgi:hypothetical protein
MNTHQKIIGSVPDETDQKARAKVTKALNCDLTAVQRHFERVTSQGPTRLQTCSFLAGLTFAAFAAILAGKPLPLSLDRPTMESLAIDTLLGAATITLLLATMGAYSAVHDLAEIAAPQTDTPDATLEKIEACYGLYHRAGDLLIWAVWGIMLSLLILGFYVSVPVGVAGLIALGFSLWYLLYNRIPNAPRAWGRERRASTQAARGAAAASATPMGTEGWIARWVNRRRRTPGR